MIMICFWYLLLASCVYLKKGYSLESNIRLDLQETLVEFRVEWYGHELCMENKIPLKDKTLRWIDDHWEDQRLSGETTWKEVHKGEYKNSGPRYKRSSDGQPILVKM